MSEEYEDLSPAEYRFKYKGKPYVLREASEDAIRQVGAVIAKAKSAVNGSDKEPEDITGLLVCLCLFEVDARGEGEDGAVSRAFVASLPIRLVKHLAIKVKDMSALDEGETVESLEARLAETEKKLEVVRAGGGRAKNSPGATTGTSA